MLLCIIILYCALFIVHCKQEHAYSGIQVSPAYRLDRKNNEEAINSTRNMIINNNEFYY